MVRWIFTLLAVAHLVACAPLVADTPLFSVADQIAPAPIEPGIWIAPGDDCPVRNLQRRGRFPATCNPIEIRALGDGSWQARVRPDLMSGDIPDLWLGDWFNASPTVFVLIPAVGGWQEGAPLYIAEARPRADERRVSYVGLIPTGVDRPAFVLLHIDCESVLREGPIDGVRPEYARAEVSDTTTSDLTQASPQLSACVAQNQEAVREAVRRQALQDLPLLIASPETYTLARPLDD